MDQRIYLSSPHIGDAEQRYVNEAFDTNWIAPIGPHLDRFEERLGTICSKSNVAALSSGTAAIHLGLKLLGVERDDFVLCQTFTFCGSANPIVYLGAKPVFIDSDEVTWNLDPSALEDALLKLPKRPKCIIPVHLYGMPAQLSEIRQVADRFEVPILEDAAEALGSLYNNEPCGYFGDLSVLSFNGNKIITTSGGGALLGNDKDLITKAKFLATQARDTAAHYEHTEIGYNYRLSNVSAAIGLGQLEVLEERVLQRRENHKRYLRYFEEVNKRGYSITFQPELSQSFSNRWLTCILLDPKKNKGVTREDLRLHLASKNIEARPLWKPMHLQPVFKSASYIGGSVSEQFFQNGLCLPSGSNLSDKDFDRIFDSFDEIFI